MTTYTVFRLWDSSSARSGLTAVEAAKEIIGYDDYVCELRREGKLWCLYTSTFSRNSGAGYGSLVRTGLYSTAKNEEEAWEEIAKEVIASRWDEHPIAVPDEEFLEYLRAAATAEANADD